MDAGSAQAQRSRPHAPGRHRRRGHRLDRHRARTQRHAIDAVVRSGGQVAHDAASPFRRLYSDCFRDVTGVWFIGPWSRIGVCVSKPSRRSLASGTACPGDRTHGRRACRRLQTRTPSRPRSPGDRDRRCGPGAPGRPRPDPLAEPDGGRHHRRRTRPSQRAQPTRRAGPFGDGMTSGGDPPGKLPAAQALPGFHCGLQQGPEGARANSPICDISRSTRRRSATRRLRSFSVPFLRFGSTGSLSSRPLSPVGGRRGISRRSGPGPPRQIASTLSDTCHGPPTRRFSLRPKGSRTGGPYLARDGRWLSLVFCSIATHGPGSAGTLTAIPATTGPGAPPRRPCDRGLGWTRGGAPTRQRGFEAAGRFPRISSAFRVQTAAESRIGW